MLTQFSFYKYIFIIFISIVFSNDTFSSKWGHVRINNSSSNIDSRELKTIINEHIDYINFNFPKIDIAPINVSIINDKLVKRNNIFSWSLGITKGKNNIVIKNPSIHHISKKRFNKVVKHELNHIYLNRLNKGNNDIPRWFSEGFCLKFASEISLNHSLTVIKHLNDKNMFNIFDIDKNFSSKLKNDFQFGYAVSAVLINLISDI